MPSKWFMTGESVLQKELRTDLICASNKNVVFVMILSIKIEIQAGKESAVNFSTGQEPLVYKNKNGHLMVVRWALSLLLCSKISLPTKTHNMNQAICHCRFPLELGHANMWGWEDTQEAHAYFIRKPLRGDQHVYRNTPEQKQRHFRMRWAYFVIQYTHTQWFYFPLKNMKLFWAKACKKKKVTKHSTLLNSINNYNWW